MQACTSVQSDQALYRWLINFRIPNTQKTRILGKPNIRIGPDFSSFFFAFKFPWKTKHLSKPNFSCGPRGVRFFVFPLYYICERGRETTETLMNKLCLLSTFTLFFIISRVESKKGLSASLLIYT